MKVCAIIQARTGSTRLPAKVLLPLAGKSMLQNIIERVSRAKLVDEVVLAVPKSGNNLDLWKDFLSSTPVWSPDCDESDLITRFYRTAECVEADLIVRICSDNPCVEPREIDRAIEYYNLIPSIFVSNAHSHSCLFNGYPDGIGCEVFSFSRLQWLQENVVCERYREHPHAIFHDTNEVKSPHCPTEFSGHDDLKLDVNTREEYEYIKDIYDHFGHNNFHITEVIKYLDSKNQS